MSRSLRNILYVEDEPDIQLVVKLALEAMAGMHVIGCNSGAEALARGADTDIDLILLDVMMPEMDGPTTLNYLRKIPKLAHTPVVFMTAKAHPDEVAHFKSLGALDVIAKPFDPMTLGSTLQSIWMRFLAEVQPLRTPAITSERNALSISAEERFAARMALLTAQFQRELPNRFDTLLQQWQALKKAPSLDALNALHGSAHNFAGVGTTFGYDDLTTRARELDRLLRNLLAQPSPALGAENPLWMDVSSRFTELETELRRILAQLEL